MGHGVHLTSQLTLRNRRTGAYHEPARADPPAKFGGQLVSGVVDLAEGDGAAGGERGERARRGRRGRAAASGCRDLLTFRAGSYCC